MGLDQSYSNQVDLLLDVLPVINKFDCFALKGGTAINLFVRDMPRLSVDIDLAYMPIESRETFLKNIEKELLDIKGMIEAMGFIVAESRNKDSQLSKLIVSTNSSVIKIEPNLVIRGSVFECEVRDLCQKAQDKFLKFSSVKSLSLADLYGGKICAALDRCHPRDLYDVKLLLDDQGISDEIRQAFIVYLISSPRPMHELLNPQPNINVGEFERLYASQFIGMTDEEQEITVDKLVTIRKTLIEQILKGMSKNEKEFLLSLKSGEPDWSLMSVPGVENLPSVQWKLSNINKMSVDKRRISLGKLQVVLGVG